MMSFILLSQFYCKLILFASGSKIVFDPALKVSFPLSKLQGLLRKPEHAAWSDFLLYGWVMKLLTPSKYTEYRSKAENQCEEWERKVKKKYCTLHWRPSAYWSREVAPWWNKRARNNRTLTFYIVFNNSLWKWFDLKCLDSCFRTSYEILISLGSVSVEVS